MISEKKYQGSLIKPFSRIALFLVLFFLSGNIRALIQVSDSTKFSLITCAPGTEVYSLFGHSAIRLKDKEQNIDLVFNYGLFSFQSKNFYWNFSRGHTDYLLGVQRYPGFIHEYIAEDRTVRELVLNLNLANKQQLLSLLTINLKPENRVYRYNYFTNNCATKIRDILQESAGDELNYYSSETFQTSYRKIVRSYLKPYAWTWLGTDVCLGLPADFTIFYWESMFLPDFLHEGFAKSKLSNAPLVHNSIVLHQGDDPVAKTPLLLTPVFVFSYLLIFFIWGMYREKVKGFSMLYLDFAFYLSLGLAGVLVAFFSFVSVHPTVYPNLNLLWAFPSHIVFSFFILKNPDACWKNIYRKVFGVLVGVLFVMHLFNVQYINYSLFPVFVIMVLRSKFHLLNKLFPNPK